MDEHDIECPECEVQYTILAHYTDDKPLYCAFCGSQLSTDDDEDVE